MSKCGPCRAIRRPPAGARTADLPRFDGSVGGGRHRFVAEEKRSHSASFGLWRARVGRAWSRNGVAPGFPSTRLRALPRASRREPPAAHPQRALRAARRRHQRSPGARPGNPSSGIGVERSFPRPLENARNSAVSTTHTVCDPRSSELVSQHPLRKNPVTGDVPHGARGPPWTLLALSRETGMTEPAVLAGRRPFWKGRCRSV